MTPEQIKQINAEAFDKAAEAIGKFLQEHEDTKTELAQLRERCEEYDKALELIARSNSSNSDNLLIPYYVHHEGKVMDCHPGYVAYYERARIKGDGKG